MRILVLGGNGQVGRHLISEAGRRGWEVVAPGREQLDLQMLKSTTQVDLAYIDGVLNAAAYTAVDDAEDEIDKAEQLNATVPLILANACAQASIPLVHYSTDYVFDGKSDEGYRECDETRPLGVYGRTKRQGELNIEGSTATTALLRLSWVFSEHGKNFVKTMLRLGRQQDVVRVVDDQRGCPTPANGAAVAGLDVLAALISNPEKSGIYHYTGDKAVSWAEFAASIFESAGFDVSVDPIKTEEYPTKAERPRYSVLCNDQIFATFGIEAANWRRHLDKITPMIIKELDMGEKP